jgi:hypothetical protein
MKFQRADRFRPRPIFFANLDLTFEYRGATIG